MYSRLFKSLLIFKIFYQHQNDTVYLHDFYDSNGRNYQIPRKWWICYWYISWSIHTFSFRKSWYTIEDMESSWYRGTELMWFISYLEGRSHIMLFKLQKDVSNTLLPGSILRPLFIRPFEKRDVLCRGNVRPSVCPSVRPRFLDFSSTCFEISIWNLVYTFNRWHDMSSLSCITIGSFWPSLQPKVGQTHFFCNHGLINQDKFFKFGTQVTCWILLDISSVFVKILFSEFWRFF